MADRVHYLLQTWTAVTVAALQPSRRTVPAAAQTADRPAPSPTDTTDALPLLSWPPTSAAPKALDCPNPNCLHNLVPPPESYRQAGLWAKQAQVVATLGADPAATVREVHSVGRGGVAL